MARDWETWLANAARGPSDAEKEARDRTEKRIRAAIESSPDLVGRTSVFVKGSYANNTNVRSDADVDIAVRWEEWSFVEKAFSAEGMTPAQLGYSPSSDDGPSPATFRRWVRDALVGAFGSGIVTEGNKAILVAGSSSTLDADVVPCFGNCRYDGPGQQADGILVFPKDGTRFILNWPQQNLENGRLKNRLTSKRYKRIVRATKRLENDMVANGLLEKEVPSFLIECLLWNVSDDDYLSSDSLLQILRNCFIELWGALRDKECDEWGEVNELKYLFRPGQPWTVQEAYAFIDTAWGYVGIG